MAQNKGNKSTVQILTALQNAAGGESPTLTLKVGQNVVANVSGDMPKTFSTGSCGYGFGVKAVINGLSFVGTLNLTLAGTSPTADEKTRAKSAASIKATAFGGEWDGKLNNK